MIALSGPFGPILKKVGKTLCFTGQRLETLVLESDSALFFLVKVFSPPGRPGFQGGRREPCR